MADTVGGIENANPPVKLWDKIKIFYPKLILAVVAGLIFWLVSTNLTAYSSYGNAILLVVASGFLFYAFDKWVLHGFDTMEEIKKGNMAVAVFILAYSIITGCAIIAAFK
jgi:uncharacterized membrane protein YjfL (UPF0719 family)